jgi:hypothetical protein
VRQRVQSIAFDGTSATAMLIDRRDGSVLAAPKLYNEGQPDAAVAAVHVSTWWCRSVWPNSPQCNQQLKINWLGPAGRWRHQCTHRCGLCNTSCMSGSCSMSEQAMEEGASYLAL